MKEHCVRAHQIIVWTLKLGGFGKGGKGILTVVGKGHKIKAKQSNGEYYFKP